LNAGQTKQRHKISHEEEARTDLERVVRELPPMAPHRRRVAPGRPEPRGKKTEETQTETLLPPYGVKGRRRSAREGERTGFSRNQELARPAGSWI
jgi:hypothetical protein